MAQNPNPSKLDPGQIIKRVYDEENDQLRTTIDASVNIGGQQTLVISDVEDSIQIGNGLGNKLAINSDGSINVDISTQPSSPQNIILVYNEITNVASGIETIVNTYTAPINKNSYILFINNAGNNVAEWRIYKNSSVFDKAYTYFTELNSKFDYRSNVSTITGYKLSPGDIVSIKILHNRPSVGNFNSRIEVLEIG